ASPLEPRPILHWSRRSRLADRRSGAGTRGGLKFMVSGWAGLASLSSDIYPKDAGALSGQAVLLWIPPCRDRAHSNPRGILPRIAALRGIPCIRYIYPGR